MLSKKIFSRLSLRKTLLIIVSVVVLLGGLAAALLLTPFSRSEGHVYLYLHEGDSRQDVISRLETTAQPRRLWAFRLAAAVMCYNHVLPGRYEAGKGVTTLTLLRHLRGGHQDAVMLTIPPVRTVEDLAGRLSRVLEPDSVALLHAFRDTVILKGVGCDTANVISIFIPNTYAVYWNITPQQLLERMHKESEHFWTPERRSLAAAIGLQPQEVMTLASIVEQETANDAERPMIAGMYLNRLKAGMKLQADPTVKFALGDFSLRRILQVHLTVDSPYNTYHYEGLPPGPICVPSLAAIEAVLHYARHDYLYMCAKEDFSGTHRFAVTYEEHLQNARRYAAALNEREIH